MGIKRTALAAILSSMVFGPQLPRQDILLDLWDTSSITPVADGTPVTSWVGSVNGTVATQSSGPARPFYYANQYGGKAALRFPNTAWLTIGRPAAFVAAMAAQMITQFIVFKSLGSADFGVLISNGHDDGGSFVYADGTICGRFFGGLDDQIPHAAQNQLGAIGLSVNKDFTGGSGNGIERFSINGGTITQASGLSPALGPTGNFSIGGDANGNFKANADICAVGMWAGPLTPTDLLLCMKWACYRFGITPPWSALNAFTIYDGNSLDLGIGVNLVSDAPAFKSALALGLVYGQWSNVSIGGIRPDGPNGMTALAPSQVINVPDAIGKPIRVFALEWWNQSGADPGPRNNSIAYLTAIRSSLCKACWGTSMSNVNDPDPNRAAYDAWFEANGLTVADAIANVHLNADMGVAGAYAINGGPPGGQPDGRGLQLWSDGVHLSTPGYALYEPYMTAGLASLTFP